MQEQSFFIVRCKHTGKFEWIRFEQNKENFISKALVVALKKKLKTYNHFSRLYLHFPDFFQVWKIAGQTSWLFQKFKTLYEPCQ